MSKLTERDIELLKASIGNRAAAGSGLISKIYGLLEDIHDDNREIVKENNLPSRVANISVPTLLGSILGAAGGAMLGNSAQGGAAGIGGGSYIGQMLGGGLGGGLGAYVYNKKLKKEFKKKSSDLYKKAYIEGFMTRAFERTRKNI